MVTIQLRKVFASWLILLAVQPAHAQFLQQGSKLVAPGATGNARQGAGVSLAGDGRTAVVGAPFDNGEQGAAFLHEDLGGSWSDGIRLAAPDAVGAARQGWSVAISEDGNTVIVGGARDSNFAGAAWVYTRSSVGGWTLPAKLVATDASGSGAMQGWTVALSADGTIAVFGGPLDGSTIPPGEEYDASQTGAAWVAILGSDGSWTIERLPQPSDLSAGAHFGTSVSISSTGNTILVGAPYDDNDIGAAWIYERAGGTWSPLPKLVAPGSGFMQWQGQSVALSGDGNTAVVGALYDAVDGASWVYSRSAMWTGPTKLVGTPGVLPGSAGSQGSSVSVANDGRTLIVGAPSIDDSASEGCAWLFALNTNNVWTQMGSPLVGTGSVGSASQGFDVALSADGHTAMVGGLLDDTEVGATWTFAQAVACPDVFFESVGDLAGDCYMSTTTDISANGEYVTVNSSADEVHSATDGGLCDPVIPGVKHSNEAAGWTRPCRHLGFFAPPLPGVGGLKGLGYLPGANAQHDESLAYGISGDGEVAVGYSNYGPSNETRAVAFLPDGIHELSLLDASTVASDISEVGAIEPNKFTGSREVIDSMSLRVIVGYTTTSNQEPIKLPGARAVYWDSWIHVEPLPHPSVWKGKNIVSSEALCISEDGAMIGGRLYYDQRANPAHYMSFPCVWRLDTSIPPGGTIYTLMAVLDDLPGGDENARITHISADGKVLVGWGTQSAANPDCWDTPSTACKWVLNSSPTQAWGAPEALTPLSGAMYSVAHGANQDGSVIVGTCLNVTGECDSPWFEDQAVRWTGGGSSSAPEVIATLLGSNVPSGWTLFEALSVSADGTIATGYGFDPDFNLLGWVAGMP